MTLPQRPCLVCGILTRSTTSRCGPHEREHQRARNAARKAAGDPHRTNAWTRQSKAARKAQPSCAICGARSDLTLDREHGQVECRSCNSSHRRNAG